MVGDTTIYRDKMRKLGCVVVVPTYNNAATILRVITDIRQYTDHIIVVNDGSTDATAEILSGIEGIEILGYEKNRGKGYALRYGLEFASRAGYRYAITMDSDGQHFADDIPVFLKRIEERPDALPIGARNLAADNMPSKNTFANKFSNFWYRVETGHRLSDTQSGFRLYPLRRLCGMRFSTSGYEFEVEVIVRAAWRGVCVENVPIKVYYPPAGERVSHFRPLRDFARISVLNTVLVLYALLVYYPWRFVRSLTRENIKRFVDSHILHSRESNFAMAASMGWGVFCGIIPIWGYQMIFAAVAAHFMRLNKVVAVVFSNISIPPMIPVILYMSMVVGAWLLGVENSFTIENVSMDAIGLSLWQYIVGSVGLAAIAGVAVFVVAWAAMSLMKRRVRYE